MANIDDYYRSSKYLSASDFDEPAVLKISHWEAHTMRDGDVKVALFFTRGEKSLLLNVTNKNVMRELYGPDPDKWSGKEIRLIATETEYQGSTVPCIRLRPPSGAASPKQTAQTSYADLDDEIPFVWAGALILPWVLALLGGGTGGMA